MRAAGSSRSITFAPPTPRASAAATLSRACSPAYASPIARGCRRSSQPPQPATARRWRRWPMVFRRGSRNRRRRWRGGRRRRGDSSKLRARLSSSSVLKRASVRCATCTTRRASPAAGGAVRDPRPPGACRGRRRRRRRRVAFLSLSDLDALLRGRMAEAEAATLELYAFAQQLVERRLGPESKRDDDERHEAPDGARAYVRVGIGAVPGARARTGAAALGGSLAWARLPPSCRRWRRRERIIRCSSRTSPSARVVVPQLAAPRVRGHAPCGLEVCARLLPRP